ncbi:putative protein TPRXL [Tetranychus urticae]|uniref:C2H2-type domain-containing protein n=1 Tax=Tetranychus urticae TaxID=32264 RepID=T1KQ89_TETUR|nr:putative protein TPRXL [Tetranychus urticae]
MVMLTDEALAELAKIENIIGDYICRLCCQKFENAFSLALHRCSKIVHVVHRCPECAKVFNCPANLASHRRWHKPRSSLGLKDGKDGEDFDEEEGEIRKSIASPMSSNGSESPTPPPLPPPPPPPQLQSQSTLPPPPKKTKTVCVTGTVKIDQEQRPPLVITPSINANTILSSPIPLVKKSPIKMPIKSSIRSPASSPPPPKMSRPSTEVEKYTILSKCSKLMFTKTIKAANPIDSDLPLALTLPTTPASPTSPKSPPTPPRPISSSSSSSPGPKSTTSMSESGPFMVNIGSSSSSPSSPSSLSSTTTQSIETPTTPPPTPPLQNLQQQQLRQSTSAATIIGEMTTMTKEPLFGWTYYPKKFRRQAYMRIKHCCP